MVEGTEGSDRSCKEVHRAWGNVGSCDYWDGGSVASHLTDIYMAGGTDGTDRSSEERRRAE